MATRIVEGQLPYRGGTGIEIDANKVIKILLRSEDNLIKVTDDNELYTDLQLADGIKPTDEFPVGVTVGRVLSADGWYMSGTMLNFQTTSGDYGRWIYGTDGHIYYDAGTGTWQQIYTGPEVDALFQQLRNSLATVAFTGDYNDLLNRPQQQTVNDPAITVNQNGVQAGKFTLNQATPDTINLTDTTYPTMTAGELGTGTDTTDRVVSAKVIADYVEGKIDTLLALGKFLSLWDATTGQPISFPLATPYTYTTGDYFLVETVSSATPPVNYKPTGSQYTGTASSTAETDELEVGDIYIYDGTTWLLQINHGKSVSFANLAGQPTDNANLATALNAKADDNAVVKLTGNQTIAGTKTFSTSPVVPSKTTSAGNNGTSIATEAQIYSVAQTIPTKTSELNNDSGFITSASIPTVNDATLTISQGGTSKGTFTANASSNASIDLNTSFIKTQTEYDNLPASKGTDGNFYFIYTESGGGGWQPGANTLAYYTLNNDGTNQSTATTKFSDVILNTATYTTTKAHGTNAYSLYCDGSTYAYVPASALHDFGTNDFTFSCWVYSETNSGQYPGFVSNVVAAYPNQGNGAYRISDRFSNVNQYNFCWDGYNNWQNVPTGTSIKDGWHNCIVTRINKIFYIYLDGNQVGTITTRTDKGCGVNGNIFLGYNLIDQLYSKCYLNDVIFESVGWSAQDASDYYQATA